MLILKLRKYLDIKPKYLDIDYEIVNGVQYQQGGSRTASKITNMGFRRENVGLLRDILGRAP